MCLSAIASGLRGCLNFNVRILTAGHQKTHFQWAPDMSVQSPSRSWRQFSSSTLPPLFPNSREKWEKKKSLSSLIKKWDPNKNLLMSGKGLTLVVKSLPTNAGDFRDSGSIPGSGRSPGGGHDNPLQYSCQENPPWTEDPDGLLSIGSQRVGHDWSNLAQHNTMSGK